MKIKFLFKSVILILIFGSCAISANAQSVQGKRPTTFDVLPELKLTTELYTQDSVTHKSYKFTLADLKNYLDSLDSNIGDVQIGNGLHKENDSAKLGGILTKNTKISGNGKSLSFSNNNRFFINQSSLTDEQLDSLIGQNKAKTVISSRADNDSSHGIVIEGTAQAEGQNTAGMYLAGTNVGNAMLSGGVVLHGTNAGIGINTIGAKVLGQNAKGFGIWMEGNTADTTNTYSDILVYPINKKLKIVNLNTDNTATQILAKNAVGNSVWRDVSSLGSLSVVTSNGISGNGTSGNPIKLGGTLTGGSTITGNGGYLYFSLYNGGFSIYTEDTSLNQRTTINNQSSDGADILCIKGDSIYHQSNISVRPDYTIISSGTQASYDSSSSITVGYNQLSLHSTNQVNLYSGTGTYYLALPSVDNSMTKLLGVTDSGRIQIINRSSLGPYFYTPSSSSDSNGDVGDVAYDNTYWYVKSYAGWKRVALSTW